MLPKVKKEILDSAVFSGSGNLEFIKEKVAEIKVDNPLLFSILVTTAHREDWTEDQKNCYILGALQFYTLMSMQDSSNELYDLFPLD